MRPPLSDVLVEAQGRWRSILAAVGLTDLSNKHGPCPQCGGKDRFRFDDKEGRGSWICSKCGSGDGMDLLQHATGLDFKGATDRLKELLPGSRKIETKPEMSEAEKMAAIKRVWASSVPIKHGDPVWTYLKQRCGIFQAPDDVRYHESLRYDEKLSFPAMVAVVRNVGGYPVSLHRTYLTEDGQKARVETPKKLMPGKSIKGAAIRLGSRSGHVLGVAEGIETALCAAQLHGLVVWSCISAGGLESFDPPYETEIVAFADNDENCVGQIAGYKLKARMHERRIHVDLRIPEHDGDWADVYASKGTK